MNRFSQRHSRRTFVKELAFGAVAVGLGTARVSTGFAQSTGRQPQGVLTGTDFDLRIGPIPINITGSDRTAFAVNGSVPAPLLRWREGDTVTLRVANTLREDASIHWHGILLPANMDGVPGLSFHGIRPNETYTYRFNVRQAGTYWYHSHSGFQEQQGVYGPLVIESKEPEPFKYDREHVVLLSDWTDEKPERVFAKLKKQSDYYNFHKRTLGDFFRDVRERGLGSAVDDRLMWGDMRMNPTDLADVSGATYTYLMNGIAPAGNWTGLFKAGEKVRLRFINGSAMSYFDVRIPGLKMTVVAADGLNVHPVTVDEFRIATAETFDVIVEPTGQDAFTIFAQAMDRTGFAAGTLAVREGLRAKVPEPDPRPLLSMDDMGHGGMGHDMGAMTDSKPAPAAADPHAGHNMPAKPAPAKPDPADPHAGHTMPPKPADPADPHAGHNMPAQPPVDPHAGHNMAAMGSMQSHPSSEDGNPLVDMQTMSPMAKLDDPGIGLRNNGRKVLTYSDLKSTFDDPDGREPGRTIELHLTGHMERFAWSFDGIKFSSSEPIRLTYGERLRIVLVNDTMMSHPIHLHGMWSDLEDEQGQFQVRKHTIDMPPGTKRSYRVRADALGRWAYHCHLLFHMESGMFREVRVDE
ncbi:MAG TPA: copper resistance system multicopper oxidase [Vicinamibacterales bacterium]|nr:copper resistance system multicopper oxidase [Vicinamibacterales bacterium]